MRPCVKFCALAVAKEVRRMRKKIILRHWNFNKQKTGQVKRAVILVGILALGLILLAGCRQRPKEVELQKKEVGEAIYEEMVPPEEVMVQEEPEIAEAPPVVQIPAPPREPAPIKAPVVEEKPVEVKVEEAAPLAKKPSLVMEKIDTDGDGIPDTFVIKGEPGAAPAPAKRAVKKKRAAAAGGKININTASAKELESIPGVGPATAKKIIAGRPYGSIEEIMDVKGIGEKTFGKMKSKITI